MDGCCPSPDYPIIQPDVKALRLRRMLKGLYYGQACVCVIKFILFGTLVSMFQLINLWVAYSAYATMHFCSVLIYLIMCSFAIMYVNLDWKRLMVLNNDKVNPFFMVLFSFMVIYYVIAVYYSYQAYKHFKALFIQQHGDVYQHGEEHNNREHSPFRNDEEANY